jgi:hypothetical protein
MGQLSLHPSSQRRRFSHFGVDLNLRSLRRCDSAASKQFCRGDQKDGLEGFPFLYRGNQRRVEGQSCVAELIAYAD